MSKKETIQKAIEALREVQMEASSDEYGAVDDMIYALEDMKGEQ